MTNLIESIAKYLRLNGVNRFITKITLMAFFAHQFTTLNNKGIGIVGKNRGKNDFPLWFEDFVNKCGSERFLSCLLITYFFCPSSGN